MTAIVAERFHSPKPVIGLISLPPVTMPGDPGQLSHLMDRVEQETLAWISAGIDGLLVENTFQPWAEAPDVPHHYVSLFTLVVNRVVRLSGTRPVGVSVLNNHPALAASVAWATGAQWVRQPVAAGCRLTQSGMLNARIVPADLNLFTLSDATPDHWLPGQQSPWSAIPGHALLTPAACWTTPLDNGPPVWLLDDGSPPDLTGWLNADGAVIRTSVLRSAAQPELQTVDPQQAKRWVQGFKAAMLSVAE